MKIIVNGEQRDAAGDTTILGLLESLGLNPQGTVAERNGVIVDRSAFAETVLAEGDTLELVRFVGGG
jgi:thiamine biosynthesis protein ThiS